MWSRDINQPARNNIQEGLDPKAKEGNMTQAVVPAEKFGLRHVSVQVLRIVF